MLNDSATSPPVTDSEASEEDLLSLARALVFLAMKLDRPCGEAQAYRLISELSRSQPGLLPDSWWSWLLSAGRSLGLSLRVSDVPARDLTAILRSGACVVAERCAAQDHRLSLGELELTQIVLVGSLPTASKSSTQPRSSSLIRVIIAATEPELGAAHQGHEKPWVMLWKLLAPDQKDIWAVVAISAIAGVLMLSVPVTAQQLVRTVTFATLYQPIVLLSLMLLGLLGFVAALQALQVYVAEIIQRRLFVRIASQITYRLIQANAAVWRQYSMPELVNRFLEVAIVQKVVASLIVDGIAIVLTTLISMSVMAFYHPYLLGYDFLLLVLLTAILFGCGRNGVKTAIEESRTKYGVLSWLEDMAHCPGVFRTGGVELLAMQRTDVLCADYLHARQSHFSILMRQIVLVLALQVIATTTLLGLGGFLVVNEQLTLGQLVAAELIVAMIVASFAKLGKHLEGWYDLLASVDKLSHLLDLPAEPNDGLIGLSRQGPAEFVIRETTSGESGSRVDVAPNNDVLRVAPGEAAVLFNWNPSRTHELADLLRGVRDGSASGLMIDGVYIDDIRADVIREHVAVVGDLEFLPGTIVENIHLSRPRVSESDVRDACEAAGLTENLHVAGLNLSTHVLPTGVPLDFLQQRRLLLARALAGKPRMLFIDHICDAFPIGEFNQFWLRLRRCQLQMTVVVATSRNDIAQLAGDIPKNSDAVPGIHEC